MTASVPLPYRNICARVMSVAPTAWREKSTSGRTALEYPPLQVAYSSCTRGTRTENVERSVAGKADEIQELKMEGQACGAFPLVVEYDLRPKETLAKVEPRIGTPAPRGRVCFMRRLGHGETDHHAGHDGDHQQRRDLSQAAAGIALPDDSHTQHGTLTPGRDAR